jgi:hypothetical protein
MCQGIIIECRYCGRKSVPKGTTPKLCPLGWAGSKGTFPLYCHTITDRNGGICDMCIDDLISKLEKLQEIVNEELAWEKLKDLRIKP